MVQMLVKNTDVRPGSNLESEISRGMTWEPAFSEALQMILLINKLEKDSTNPKES